MKARLIAAYLAAAALSVPAVAYSAGTEKDSMPKDTMSRDTAPNTMSRDTAPKKEGGVMSDAMITTKIKAEFAKDKAVSAMKINVDTDKGVVKLGGTAKSKAEADKAEQIAKNIAGVSSVHNDIKVQTN
jgi:hyperosmotically inducible periplasmic protein